MKRFAPLALVILAGCAAPMTLEQQIAAASTMDLCEAVYYAPPMVGMQARAEAERRGVNCTDHMAEIVQYRSQKEQMRANQAAAALQFMQMTRPQPIQPYVLPQIEPSPSIHCNSTRYGNTVSTNCN